jgi:hypothetical protein
LYRPVLRYLGSYIVLGLVLEYMYM